MNNYLLLTYNLLILISIIVLIPILCTFIFSLLKRKNFKNLNIYLYSFTAGLLFIIGTMGFLAESYEKILHRYENDKFYYLYLFLTIGLGSIFGVIISILSRFVVARKNNNKLIEHCEHNHIVDIFNLSDLNKKSSSWSTIILLLSHRIIEGLSLGMLIVSSMKNEIFRFENLGIILVFIIHIIPETIVIYDRLEKMNISRTKIFIHILVMKLIIIPFLFIGAFLFNFLNNYVYLISALMACTGVILIFVAVIEIVPEFIHTSKINAKTWYTTLGFFGLGLITSILISLIHSH